MSERASPGGPTFSPAVVGWLLFAGIAFFVGLTMLGAYEPDLSEGSDGGGHAVSRSAIGFAGLRRLLVLTGVPTLVSRGPTPSHGGPPGIEILTPAPGQGGKSLDEVLTRRPELIILPKWRTFPDPRHRGWVTKVGTHASEVATAAVEDSQVGPLDAADADARPVLTGVGAFAGQRLRLGSIERFQAAQPRADGVLLVDGLGRPVLIRVRPGRFVLTDPDMMNNQGLRSLANARAALAILDNLRAGGPVVFDVTLAGFKRERSLLRLMLAPPFLGAAVAALAAAALMGAHALVRFGPVRRPGRRLALGKAALVDNAAAMIALAGKEAGMARRYWALTGRLIARAAGLPESPAGEVDAGVLDRLTPAGEESFTSLGEKAAAARSPGEIVEAARRLRQRSVEMAGERV